MCIDVIGVVLIDMWKEIESMCVKFMGVVEFNCVCNV